MDLPRAAVTHARKIYTDTAIGSLHIGLYERHEMRKYKLGKEKV